MKYIKKFEDKEYEETTKWEPKDNIQGLKEVFNLVLPNPEVFKIPYFHYNSKNPDFCIYVVSGIRAERDDHKFLQELYHNHQILNDIYNLDFFNITLSSTKTYATIVLYDYIMDPNYNKNIKNYISHDIIESKLPLPSNIKNRLKPAMLKKNHSNYLTKGILYSNGNSGSLILSPWVYEQPEDFRKQYEDINVPIKVGDTILGGRFKNKKVVVKKIGKNKKGDITVNDKPLLKYRLVKESIEEEIDNALVYLTDDGFKIHKTSSKLYLTVQLFKQKEYRQINSMDNLVQVKWSDIESDLLPFIEMYKDRIKDITLAYSTFTEYGVSNKEYVDGVTDIVTDHNDRASGLKVYDRKVLSPDEILDGEDFGKILKVNIRLQI